MMNAEMNNNEIEELAQKYTSDCPVVILGSGASIPHGLPSMSRLAETLSERIGSEADDWVEFKKMLISTKDLETTLHKVHLSEGTLARVVAETWKIFAEPDRALFERLVAEEEDLPLSRLLRFLLRTAGRRVSIITTNYDRLAEYAAGLAGALPFTGFAPGWIQRFIATGAQLSQRDHPRTPGLTGRVDIWKVHGSLDWFIRPSGEAIGLPGAASIPSDLTPLVVTPGVSKYRETQRDPFRTVMTQSDATLAAADSYLCVGYGFNDEHVQPELLRRARQSGIPVVVVARTLTPAAKQLFLNGSCKKYLLLERSNAGTRAYLPGAQDGVEMANVEAWNLSGFLDIVLCDQGDEP